MALPEEWPINVFFPKTQFKDTQECYECGISLPNDKFYYVNCPELLEDKGYSKPLCDACAESRPKINLYTKDNSDIKNAFDVYVTSYELGMDKESFKAGLKDLLIEFGCKDLSYFKVTWDIISKQDEGIVITALQATALADGRKYSNLYLYDSTDEAA